MGILNDKMTALANAVREKQFIQAGFKISLDDMTAIIRAMPGYGSVESAETLAADVSAGKVFYTYPGITWVGTMPDTSLVIDGNSVTVPAGRVREDIAVKSGSVILDGNMITVEEGYVFADELTVPEGTLSQTDTGNTLVIGEGYYKEQTVTVGNAVEGYTITPGTREQIIPAGSYLSGNIAVAGDSELVPENIVSGKSIFGVAGTASAGGIPGGSVGSSADFYKCSAVYGPKKVSGFVVSGAGTAAVNGKYLPTDLTTEEGSPVYKHETSEYYYFEMCEEKGICTSPTDYPGNGLYYNMYNEGWTIGSGGAEPAPTVTKGNIILNAEAPKTWDGYKAIWTDESGYSFEETLTTGLSYGTGFTPDVGNIYDGNATVIVAALYKHVEGRSVLTLSTRDSGITGAYRQVEGTEYGTKNCRWNYVNNTYPSRNIHWGTPTDSGFYGDDDYVGVEGWHVFDGENENKVWLGNGAFPTAPTHWDANSTLTETVENWE